MDGLPAGSLRAAVLKAPEAGKFTFAAASVGTTRASRAQKRHLACPEKGGIDCGVERTGGIVLMPVPGANRPVDGRAHAKAAEP